MLATLRFYWRSSVALLLASAVTTAVLAGALLVGDGVRASLRGLVLDRLGVIDDALLSESWFREALADDLAARGVLPRSYRSVAPVILLRGSVRDPERGALLSAVNVLGVDERFFRLMGVPALAVQRSPGQALPAVVLNQAAARELGVAAGADVLLQLERPSAAPRESLLGASDPDRVLRSLRLRVAATIPDMGLGRFALAPHQSLPKVAYLALPELQRALDQRGRVNTLFLARAAGAGGPNRQADRQADLVSALTPADLGLELRVEGPAVALSSREILLRPALVAAAAELGRSRGARVVPLAAYLANRTELVSTAAVRRRAGRAARPSGRALPYSALVALDPEAARELGVLELVGGVPAPALGERDVLLNAWAAEDLDARPGDVVRVHYFEVGEREALAERTVDLVVRGVVALRGLGADASLVPAFPGIADAEDMSDWDPTFPVDLSAIGDRDEAYWDEFGAAPKLLVAPALASLWRTRFGEHTALRLLPPEGVTAPELAISFAAELPRRVDLRSLGLVLEPVRERGLEAARGATDFGGLFIGFSLFLIAAAALLVALAFRLALEQRAREIGLRLALGTSARRLRRGLLGEGLLVGGVGVALGAAAAVGYAALMLWLLRTWWRGAVGTSFLHLHVSPGTLAAGAGAALAVIVLALWRAFGRLERQPPVALLRGVTAGRAARRRSRRSARFVLAVALLAGAVASAASVATGEAAQTPLFFVAGAALLVAGLAAFALVLRRASEGEAVVGLRAGLAGPVRLALQNAALFPGRSLLCSALVAAASFVIVAVGAHGLRFGDEVRERSSGAGGFGLVAEADVPVPHDLNQRDGRFALGFNEAESAAFERARVMPFRVVPGDDISCLNLYQPQRPRLLGVPPEQIERGGFSFTALAERGPEPWRLLSRDLGEDVVPAFGDANSVRWILKSGLGRDVVVTGEHGRPVRLRLVGLLRRSVLQSELLVSERHLLEHFPSSRGYGYFLIETPAADQPAVAAALERALGGFGVDVSGTAQRLASYQAVENTYLDTFKTLGGLGLVLGTLGLAAVLLRNVLERRGELALLRALGFSRPQLGRLVVAENALLLLAGVALGTVAAALAVAPHLVSERAAVPWWSLLGTLAVVIATGLFAAIGAVRQALRAPLLPALRAE